MLADKKIEIIKFSLKLLRIDWFLLLIALGLIFLGCVALYSAAGGDWNPWAYQHLKRGVIGIFIAIIIAFIDIRVIYKIAWIPLLLSVCLLFFLHMTGDGKVNRWLDLGFIYLQPSELAKVAIVITLARFFHDIPLRDQGKLVYFILSVIIASPIIFLTLNNKLKRPIAATK